MIHTARLVLRPTEARDREPLIAMLANPEVMRDLVRNPTRETAQASIDRHIGYRDSHGLGFWTVEHDGAVAGLCGLKPGAPNTPIQGETEIGWLFDLPFWGKGLATEAARASLEWGWANTPAPRVVAITAAGHIKSQQVMDRLGMHRLVDGDFNHPLFAEEDAMRATVTFAIHRPGTH
ncbi:GNAT family N-acetyltransferase [Sphingomonas sp. S2-65]|uniref:GNAT family N-acetyltransferase n=1 Tax=Sphingomonas sp. S2-65 TaxID=2903960 RepID=UPI001F44DE7A|nr:GNAT family N-acetyltransferase [Sphingomonas sp. S2-65]UYY58946.1 GNAT family N-acetyltransferase [Sphingomonas sp. S2-65]